MGAAPNLVTPPRDSLGKRLTVNSALTGAQAVWNLRSAYNVAALNCSQPGHSSLVSSYGDFLKNNARPLRDVNSRLDSQFKAQHGSGYIKAREAYQTQVYNYFALPPVLPTLCDQMVALGQELAAVPATELEPYAVTGIARLEAVYTDFYDRYDAYRSGFAQWQLDYEARYGVPPPAGYFLPGETRVQSAQATQSMSSATSP
jgi:hypothetical protein